MALLDKDRDQYWALIVFAVPLSAAFALCYRHFPTRPRFWALVSVKAWDWIVAVILGFQIHAVFVERVSIEGLIGSYEFHDLILALGSGLMWTEARTRVISLEEADLIELHREEWEAYLCGTRASRVVS